MMLSLSKVSYSVNRWYFFPLQCCLTSINVTRWPFLYTLVLSGRKKKLCSTSHSYFMIGVWSLAVQAVALLEWGLVGSISDNQWLSSLSAHVKMKAVFTCLGAGVKQDTLKLRSWYVSWFDNHLFVRVCACVCVFTFYVVVVASSPGTSTQFIVFSATGYFYAFIQALRYCRREKGREKEKERERGKRERDRKKERERRELLIKCEKITECIFCKIVGI